MAGTALVALTWAGPRALAGAHASEGRDARYVVHPGDTLWSIAVSIVGPGEDPRATVDALAASSAYGAAIRPGQVLTLPR